MAALSERETVNGLIDICRDAARGFTLCASQVADPELKRIFTDAARQRQLFAAELLPYWQHVDADADDMGTTRGALHRRWMAVKSALAKYDEGSVLAEAIRGEAVAAHVYANAVRSMLPPNARPVIARQYAAILDTQQELGTIALPCA